MRYCNIALICFVAFAFYAAMTTVPSVFANDNDAENRITAFPLNPQTTIFMHGGREYLELSLAGWGPGWAWQSFRGSVETDGDASLAVNNTTISASGANVRVAARTEKTGPQRLTVDFEVTADRDTDLTYLIGSLSLPRAVFGESEVRVTHADESTSTARIPLARTGIGDNVSRFVLVDNAGRETGFQFEPALDVPSDNAARIVLARSLEADRPVRASFTIDLPVELIYYPHRDQVPQDSGFDQWYTFEPDTDYDMPGEIDMDGWLETPAGVHGRIEARGKDLYYNDEPIKLWGLNLCYRGGAAPSKEIAGMRAAFYPKYGINAVRLHKWADGPGWAGIQTRNSVIEFEPEGLDLFDYQNARLREAGIFLKLSQAFGTIRIGPDDVEHVPYAADFGSLQDGQRVGGGNSTLFYSRELQDLTIKQLQNILNHRNPYTDLTYAEDPAIAFIEIVNEASILFYSSMRPLQQSETLKNRTAEKFSAWLREKYGSHDALVEAWGEDAMDSFRHEGFHPIGEHLDENNILPLGNPWFWDPAQLEGSQAFRKQRLLDSMEFLHNLQVQAYERIVEGIRETGYEGEIIGSNWHAGRMYSHYANLHTDYKVGVIDRHNYMGGGGDKINNISMLRVPGSGMLSTGMEQVGDRPFMLSEWIHVLPTEWGVEGPAVIGAYGLGLQGWDVSYLFQNRDNGRFSNQLSLGGSRWDVTAPQVMGVFPAVARQVLRGDVMESETRAVRNVHMPSLFEGRLDFQDQVGSHEYDVRTFDSDKVPSRTLAVARSEIAFTDEFLPTEQFDLTPHVENGVYVSDTGQLRWREGQTRHGGHITINTPGTRAVIGFAEGRTEVLGGVTITPQSRYSAIYVTARDIDEDIQSGNNLLVVAIARARNTDMKVFEDYLVLNRGRSPIVMEPVKAEIRLEREGEPVVHVLDHNGRRTGRTLPVEDGTFTIDGSQDRTPYYLISYE